MPLLFVRRISSYCLIMSAASLGFFCFIGFLVLFFCFNRVIVNEEIYQLLFYIFFFKTLCLLAVFRVFPHLKTKNKRYTINLKHPLQTKNATPLRTKCVLLYTIKGCKSTLSQKFLKNCFQINLISKKKS